MFKNIITKDTFLSRVIRRLCDPVLIYTVLTLTSIMYHYTEDHYILYGLLAAALGLVVFTVFDFINKHHIIGAFLYLSVGFLFLIASRAAINTGHEDYPITFLLWFITPQDSVDFNAYYTFAIFILFTFFMASVIYYFNKVRYRIFMNFLIFIIPFAIYGKEYEKMPTAFILLLAVGYIVMMIMYRQLTERDGVKIVGKKTVWSSIAVYSAVFAAVAAIIPKPAIEANRDYLDMLIDADALTDKLVAALNVFRDTTEPDIFSSNRDNNIIYYAKADEPLRLKTTTFSSYDYSTDTWKVIDHDTKYDHRGAYYELRFFETGKLLEEIGNVVERRPEIAKRYGIEPFSSNDITFPDTAELSVRLASGRGQFMPIPDGVCEITEVKTDAELAKIRSNLLYADDSFFYGNDVVKYRYSRDSFFSYPRNKELSDMLCIDDYEDLLRECSEYSDSKVISDSLYSYRYIDELLDYGSSDSIKALSDDIVAGLNSDYEKAVAMVNYFLDEDFVYDLDFQKEKNANAVDFLFKDKRGVCYEFATSMVLLARAAGIPARLDIGYNMHDYDPDDEMFYIRGKDSHAFPELYIRGVGWMSFEPTVPSDGDFAANKNNSMRSLTQAGVFILILTFIILIAIKLSPVVSHKMFLLRVKNKSPEDKVVLSVLRIRKLCRIDGTLTSNEASELLMMTIGTDISEEAFNFDSIVYGQNKAAPEQGEAAINTYLGIYEKLHGRKRSKGKREKQLDPTAKGGV